MPKRFLVFGWSGEPIGGWGECEGSFDTLEEAKGYALGSGFRFWHVVDLDLDSVVWDHWRERT